MPSPRRHLPGFTLIELLTVVAIVGVLAAVVLGSISQVRDTARKSVDQSNLRQIGLSSLQYAAQNSGALPGPTLTAPGPTFGEASKRGEWSVDAFAAALAVGCGQNDARLWVSPSDKNGRVTTGASTVYRTTGAAREFTPGTDSSPGFRPLSLAHGVTLGLKTSDQRTIPIAFTRGIVASSMGIWSDTLSVYGGYGGGFLVFLDGHVQFYPNFGPSPSVGKLIGSDGNRTNDIKETVKISLGTKFCEEFPSGQYCALYSGLGK